MKIHLCSHLQGLHHKFCWSRPYRARHFFIFAAATIFTKLEQIQIFLHLPNLTKVALFQIFLCLFSQPTFNIYTKSGNFDLFNWESNNLHDNCENDSDRADTRDELPLGKISVTACMSLVRILLKRADTGRGGTPTLLTTTNLSRNKSSKFSWSGNSISNWWKASGLGSFVNIYVNTGSSGQCGNEYGWRLVGWIIERVPELSWLAAAPKLWSLPLSGS